MFCKNDFGMMDKTVLESGFEQAAKAGVTVLEGAAPCLFKKKEIILLKCTKCNKVEKVVESNPEQW